MTPDPIEAVARAICANYVIYEGPKNETMLAQYVEEHWQDYDDDARAAIAAMPKVEALAAENARLSEALTAKPWPPTYDELRLMLADIIGAWWSKASGNFLRIATKSQLKPEDIKGMYAVRDALAPYIARAALSPEPDTIGYVDDTGGAR